MRIAYLDCSTGISGDMTLGALIDAGVDVELIRSGIDSIGLDDVKLECQTVVKGGFRATHVKVVHPEQHAHRHMADIEALLDRADRVTESQKALAREIFLAVATAEAHVHGSTVEKVHFHEVGAIDSIVDIVGAAIGFDLLGADSIICSPIPTGHGQIHIDHGICTVPAPGTAELLRGIPLVDVPVEAELTTPTGAAIVKTLADRFGPLPEMTIERVGYGAGTMDFPQRANLLRLFVGTAIVSPHTDRVCLLETNLDDVSGETIGYTRSRLVEAGAVDVFSVAVQMKKDRPGVMLSVLCRPEDRETMESILFDETGTFGIRRHMIERSVRLREMVTVETPWGPVAGKRGWRQGGGEVFTPEFEDCAEVANRAGVSLRDVYRAAQAAFTPGQTTTAPPEADHSHDHDDHSHDHDDHSHDHDDHSHDHDDHSHDHDDHSHDHHDE